MSDMQESKDNSVCIWLQNERERLGLSQAIIAAAAEVTAKTVGRWEKEIAIPADKLRKLARLGFDTQFVVTGVRSSAALTTDEERLVSLFRAAPFAVRAAVMGGLEAGTDSAAGKPSSAPKYAVDFGGAQIGQVVKGMSGGVNIVENHRSSTKEDHKK